MRTRRLVSLMIALVAGIIWVLSTLANISNAWDPLNFVLRVVAGVVTVAAAAEWIVLSVRDRKRPDLSGDGETGGREAGESVLPEPGGPGVLEPREPQEPREQPERPEPQERHESRELRPHEPGVVEPGAQVGPAGPEPAAPRRSGGVFGGVLARFGRKRAPGKNLAVVTGGGSVRVVAYLMERKVRRVTLRIGLDPESLADLAETLGAAPHRVFGTQAPTRGLFDRSAYTQVEGASGSGAWSIAVPTQDVEMLRYVLARAQE